MILSSVICVLFVVVVVVVTIVSGVIINQDNTITQLANQKHNIDSQYDSLKERFTKLRDRYDKKCEQHDSDYLVHEGTLRSLKKEQDRSKKLSLLHQAESAKNITLNEKISSFIDSFE